MPRDQAGNFSLVPSYFAQAGQTIRTEQHNPPLEDIGQALTGSLPRNGSAGMVAPLDMGSFPIRNAGRGTTASDVALVGQGVPVATVVDYAGYSAPAGWFFCAGQELSRADYAALFAAMGTVHGAGNGSTTFNLPDLRGRVTAGRDDMGGTDAGRISGFFGAIGRALGGPLGTAAHVLTTGQMPSHAHGVSDPGHQHGVNRRAIAVHTVQGGPTAIEVVGPGPEFIVSSVDLANVSIQNAGSNEAHPNVQPTLILNKIIKATV